MLLSFFCIENKVKNKNYHTVILSELFQNLIKNRRNSSKIPTHMCDR